MAQLQIRPAFSLLWIACAISISSAACKKKNSSASSSSASSQTQNAGASNGAPTGPLPFSVSPRLAANSLGVMHIDRDWTKPCSIRPSDARTSNADLYCLLEMPEEDIHDNTNLPKLGLTWSLPPDFCAYFKVTPYSFYKFEPGFGPNAVTVAVIAGGGRSLVSQSGANNASALISDGALKCDRDYSGNDPAGPNCCEGKYTLTTINADGSSSSSRVDWGGKVGNCLVGPAVDTQPKDLSGFPRTVVYPQLPGQSFTDTYPIATPIEKDQGTNLYVANYYVPNASGLYTDASVWPEPIRGPAGIRGGYPWYEFGCYDHSDDLLARIRVMIRSWSSDSEFDKAAAGNYLLLGPEGVPFDASAIGDYQGWPGSPFFTGSPVRYPGNAL